MKVILLQDVKAQGKKDDVVEVNDGYARNFLFPRKLAIEANKSNMNELSNRKAAESFRAEQELKKAREQGDALNGKSVTIYQKTGAGDKLFGAVTAKEIAEEIKRSFGIDIDKKKIALAEPIKSLGEYKAELKLHVNVHVTITVLIAAKE